MATSEQLMRMLRSMAKMSPENWLQFRQELLDGAAAEDEQGYQGDPEYMEKGAMDAKAQRGFYKRYPEAQPIKTTGIANDARSPAPISAKAMAGFIERYPEAKTTRGA